MTMFHEIARLKGWRLIDIGRRWGIGERQMSRIANAPQQKDLDAIKGLPVKRMSETVIPNDYPELRLICWHCDPEKPITQEQAFGLYERNWRYVEQGRLTDAEKALIEHLTQIFGNGVING